MGLGYLSLIGLSLEPWLLPQAWRSFRWVAAPFLGWGALVAVAYPLNAALPARWVLIAVAVAAFAAAGMRAVRARPRVLLRRECANTYLGLSAVCMATMVSPVTLYAGAGALSTVVADSDVEHFADVIAAMLTYPIGWSIEAQMGLEATPIGLAYHYVHAAISAVTGVDTYASALPSHLAMIAIAPAGVYLFAREALGASGRTATIAAAVSACGGFGLGVSAFGWGQQTAALACVPAGVAGIRRALLGGRPRDIVGGGLLAALAAGSLYLASAPVVGGTALVCAVLTVRASGIRTVLRRSVGLALVVLGAGALSHLSTLGFFQRGGLTTGDVSGRSAHVSTFVTLPQALGVEPLTLFRAGESASAAIGIVAAAVGFLALSTGLALKGRDPSVSGFALTTGFFALYLREIQLFPYGEFKLLTSAWSIMVAISVAGGASVAAARPRLSWLPIGAVLLFAGGLVLSHRAIHLGLSRPWGAALPEREMDELRRIVRAIPSGAAVWVSNQLAPQSAVSWSGATTGLRHGFPSEEAGKGSLGLRWRGAATSLLSITGRPAYGLVQRHSTELRSAIDPRAADYLLLDASEDALSFGLTEADLAATAGRLRLFRGDGDPLPDAVLPFGESLPGRRQGYLVARHTPGRSVSPVGLKYYAHALWAAGETEVTLVTSTRTWQLTLFPGLSWYVSSDPNPSVTPSEAVEALLLGREPLRPGSWAGDEQLLRSPAGTRVPAMFVSGGGDASTAHYVNVTGVRSPHSARPRASERLWIAGQPVGPALGLQAPTVTYRLPLLTVPPNWLEIGIEGRAAVHAPTGTGLFALPLLGEEMSRSQIRDGTLVKGSSERLHLVVEGRARWIPTLEALQRRVPVPPVVTLGDEELWRLPVGLPLE